MSKMKNIIARTTTLLESKYGCKLTAFNMFNHSSSDFEKKIQQLIHQNYGALFITHEDHVILPIFSKTELMYAFIVHYGLFLKEGDIEQIRNMLDLTITTAALSQSLEVEQNTASILASTSGDFLSMSTLGQSPMSMESLFLNKDESNESTESRPREYLLAYLEGGHPDKAHRVAVELHHITKNFALVPISDISFASWTTVQDIKDLGEITLFIPQLGALPETTQDVITKFLALNQGEVGPQLIIHSEIDSSKLRSFGLLQENLYQALDGHRIYLDNSLNAQELVKTFDNKAENFQTEVAFSRGHLALIRKR